MQCLLLDPKWVVGFSSGIGWRDIHIHAVYATSHCSPGHVTGQVSEVWGEGGGAAGAFTTGSMGSVPLCFNTHIAFSIVAAFILFVVL